MERGGLHGAGGGVFGGYGNVDVSRGGVDGEEVIESICTRHRTGCQVDDCLAGVEDVARLVGFGWYGDGTASFCRDGR